MSPPFRGGADFIKLVLYLMFTYVIVTHYGLPLHIIRDLYFTLRSFATRLVEMIQYRRATYNMNERYPDATEAELAATDRTCIICREDMEVGKKVRRRSGPKRIGKRAFAGSSPLWQLCVSCPARSCRAATSSTCTACARGWSGSRRARPAA